MNDTMSHHTATQTEENTHMSHMNTLDQFTYTGLDTFTKGYIRAALWSTSDEVGQPLENHYTATDLTCELVEQMVRDCRTFQEENATDLNPHNVGQSGRNFWLTRNHHVAGFWTDTFSHVAGARLSQSAHKYGKVELFVDTAGIRAR